MFACEQFEWLGYNTRREGTKPLIQKTDAVEKLIQTKKFERLKSFFSYIHHLTQYIPRRTEPSPKKRGKKINHLSGNLNSR